MASRPTDLPRIRLERVEERLAAVNRFGAEKGREGQFRLSFSPADMAARRWLMDEMTALGLAARMDAAGNVIGRWDCADGPAVMAGSHLDTVPAGGPLDGALGVVAALECIETLMESGIRPGAPLEVIATSEEEGRFGGMLGAQAVAGQVDRAWFDAARDDTGLRLDEAMRAAGLDPAVIETARRDPEDIKAFLELHIEQGPVLEKLGQPVAVVSGVSGVFNWTVELKGAANHAGTTPMNLRSDAFQGLARFAAGVDAIIEEHGTIDSRMTVGKVELEPNFPHTVPGLARFSLIGRDMDEGVMHKLADASRNSLETMAKEGNLALEIREESWLAPTACHSDIIATFQRAARAMGLDAPVIPSGAGHDTQVMAELTRAGMIFVPSIGGLSHAPAEHTDREDIEIGCNVLLRAMMEIAGS